VKEKTISERENYLRALDFKNPQWIPITIEFTSAVWARYGKELKDLTLRHPLISGNHQRGWEEFEETDPICIEGVTYKDDWGCVWYNAQGGILGRVTEHPLADWKAFDSFKAPDPLEQFNWAGLKEKIEQQRQKGLLTIAEPESFAQIGFFDRLNFLRGFENLMMDFLLEPPQLDKLIDVVFDYNMKYIQKWLEIGVDVVWHHGDIGSQKGLIFDPKIFRKYLKPRYKQLFQTCRNAGSHVWYSSDGNLLEIVDDLIECGVSLHDPQVRPNTIDGIKQHYKGKLCASVDIDEQMLPFCKPEEIEHQIKEIVEKLGSAEGGLMLYAIPSQDVPLKNIEAILNAWEQHCFFNWP
jgi:hypothetical protein